MVVVGGANIDIKACSTDRPALRTSNPGRTTSSAGGVARNIAENLARLGTSVHLVAAVGLDVAGSRLLADTSAAGVDVSLVNRGGHATGSYTAVLDPAGDLVIAVADMAATDAMRPEDMAATVAEIGRAALLVIDGNLSTDTAAYLLDLARELDCRVILEPVSVAKATRLATVLDPRRPLFATTPNLAELAALTGCDTRTDAGVAAAVARLHELGVEWVWVRSGPYGSMLAGRGTEPQLFAAHPGPVVDVTGAGDAMLAAFAHVLLAGRSPSEAVRYGHAAAALTVASDRTVRDDLSAELLDRELAQQPQQ